MKLKLGPVSRAARIAVAVVFLLVVALGGRVWSSNHLRRVALKSDVQLWQCLKCHGQRPGPTWAAVRERRQASPTGLALDSRSGRLFVACAAADSIAVIDTRAARVTQRAAVAGQPHDVIVSRDGGELFVSQRALGTVAVLAAADLVPRSSIRVGDEPCGLALDPDGKFLYVANAGSDDVSVVDLACGSERSRLRAGREPYAIALTPDGKRAYVANRLAHVADASAEPCSELTVIDLERRCVVARPSVRSGHLAEGIACAADGVVVMPVVHPRNLVPIMQVAQGWVTTNALVLAGDDASTTQLPLDQIGAYLADLADVAISGDGKTAYVSAGGADQIAVVDLDAARAVISATAPERREDLADRLDLSERYVKATIATRANPRELLLADDDRVLYVAERLADSIAVIDTASLAVTAHIELLDVRERGREPSLEHQGEIVFHSSRSTFAGQFSCRSCHPDGHVDGLTYDFDIDGVGRNLVDNRSLLGVGGTNPFKWNGGNQTLAEQCGVRFAKVLTRTQPIQGQDLTALVAYLESLPPPKATGAVSAAILDARTRGQKVFERGRTNRAADIPPAKRCSTCHRPPLYTNQLTADVGTRSARDDRSEFDVPHLIGIARSAPYLHDGRALTLEEIWTVFNPHDTHGITNDLSKQQLNDLIEYLKSL